MEKQVSQTEVPEEPAGANRDEGGFYTLWLLLLIVCGVAVYLWYRGDKLSDTIREDREWISKLEERLEPLPVEIMEIEVANVDEDINYETDYGDDLRASSSMYLAFRVTYCPNRMTNERRSEELELPVELVVYYYEVPRENEDGERTLFSISYSYRDTLSVSDGLMPYESCVEELSSYGSPEHGTWTAGLYRVEIWYEGLCIGTKSFSLY